MTPRKEDRINTSTQSIQPPEGSSGRNLLKAIGPGILMAGAAIGGSHLIASTKAGAEYGWQLLGLLLLTNAFKYPFIQYGTRYTASTGKSLLEGYQRTHKAYLWVFFFVTLFTGVINVAAVSMVAGSLATNFIPSENVLLLTTFLMIGCFILLSLGRYVLLDRLSKVIILALSVTTLVAAVAAVGKGPVAATDFVGPSPWTLAAFGGLIVFMGWMPAPIELSAWPSLWMFSRQKETSHKASFREALIDLNIGYIACVVLAVAFLTLGATVLYGSGEELSAKGTVFAKQLITIFTQSVGPWTYWVIGVAAFTAMFSTSITCIDAYPRGIAAAQQLLWKQSEASFRKRHLIWMGLHVAGACVILWFFIGSLGQLLEFAMIISFLAAPVLAWMNHRVIRSRDVPREHHPKGILNWLDWAGLLFLGGFSVAFLWWYLTMSK